MPVRRLLIRSGDNRDLDAGHVQVLYQFNVLLIDWNGKFDLAKYLLDRFAGNFQRKESRECSYGYDSQ
jgi:hypothetical protein